MAKFSIRLSMILGVVFVMLGLSSVTGLPNVFCGPPQEAVVATDAPHHGFYPYFVKLHRCVGSSGLISPSLQRCVAKSYKEIPLTVRSITSSVIKTVTLTNDTSCGPECVTRPSECDPEFQRWEENQCSCKCMYQDGPPEDKKCKEGFRWNSHRCQCVCNQPPVICPIRQTWSSEVCGCSCEDRAVKRCARKRMGLDIDTCTCVDVQAVHRQPGVHPQSRMFITLMAGQAFIIIVLFCVLVHWIRKKRQPHPTDAVERLDSFKSEDDGPLHYSPATTEGSTECLEDNKEYDDSSCTAPLSPKIRITDL